MPDDSNTSFPTRDKIGLAGRPWRKIRVSSIREEPQVEAPFDFSGKVALVTGGGTGIGTATTGLLARFGADAVITSRKVENLERVSKELGAETGRRIVPVRGDVRDADSCQKVIDATLKEFGRIDFLINNAGGSYMFPFLDTPPDRFDNNMALNLREIGRAHV